MVQIGEGGGITQKGQQFHTYRGYHLLRQEGQAVLTPSQEDYLEMIYRQCQAETYVRSKGLAEQLSVAAPSVTRTVKKLAALGFIKYSPYGLITLTEAGRTAGEFLLDRHNTVDAFLRLLGVEESRFVETELIEHHVSAYTLVLIKQWVEFLRQHPDILAMFYEKCRQFS
ncbi:MAG: MarR family transcriptional regulator [Selenomonadales bacterium]|nr:MarR family transcriptional regulator [Selenomonadales bacterium]